MWILKDGRLYWFDDGNYAEYTIGIQYVLAYITDHPDWMYNINQHRREIKGDVDIITTETWRPI